MNTIMIGHTATLTKHQCMSFKSTQNWCQLKKSKASWDLDRKKC